MDFEKAIFTIQNVAKTFPDFKKLSMDKRRHFLEAFIFSLVLKKTEVLALLQSSQNMSLEVAEQEYVEALDYLHFLKARVKDDEKRRLPVGPVLIYGSWSSPLLRFCEKAVTALTLGNTVVLHTPEENLKVYTFFAELALQTHLPEFAIEVVATNDKEIIDILYSHPAIRAVNFAGHSYEGEFLKERPHDIRKKYKVHFGGRNPVLFMYDADLTDLKDFVKSSIEFHYMGEMHFNRWFVQEKIFQPFVDSVLKILEDLAQDSNGIPNSLFAQAFKKQTEELKKEKNWAQDLTALSTNGKINHAVCKDFNNCSPWQQQEVLGPLLTITRFKNSAEAIKFANTTFYANAAAVFCQDTEKAHEIAHQLTMPIVTMNRIPQRFWEKPLYSSFESGYGCDVTDIDFFSIPKVTTVY